MFALLMTIFLSALQLNVIFICFIMAVFVIRPVQKVPAIHHRLMSGTFDILYSHQLYVSSKTRWLL